MTDETNDELELRAKLDAANRRYYEDNSAWFTDNEPVVVSEDGHVVLAEDEIAAEASTIAHKVAQTGAL